VTQSLVSGQSSHLENILENFPSDMLGLRRYLVWKYAEHRDKPAKIPYIAGGGGRASSTDPATWRGFEEAADAFRTGNYDGIGVVFSAEDPYAGVDLDECRDPGTGELETWAGEIVGMLNGYTEVSPSRTGVHIIVRGAAPNRRSGKVEAYSSGRYFTVTGQAIAGHARPAPERQEGLDALAREYLAVAGGLDTGVHSRRGEPGKLSDAEVEALCRAGKNGQPFEGLFDRGDLSEHEGDPCQAETALAHLIASHTRDTEQIERLISGSALGRRAKWRDRADHRTRTIEFAIAEAIGERCK
jgi:putative DNA primase/helicase